MLVHRCRPAVPRSVPPVARSGRRVSTEPRPTDRGTELKSRAIAADAMGMTQFQLSIASVVTLLTLCGRVVVLLMRESRRDR